MRKGSLVPFRFHFLCVADHSHTPLVCPTRSWRCKGFQSSCIMALWMATSDWLVAAGILPSPSTGLLALAQELQDGTALCNLANRLYPGACSTTHQHPKPQFLCVENISSFLLACKTHFGVSEKNLFDPSDLYNGCQFNQVIDTLVLVSKCKLAKRLGIPPIAAKAQEQDEELYQALPQRMQSQSEATQGSIYGQVVRNRHRQLSDKGQSKVELFSESDIHSSGLQQADEIYGEVVRTKRTQELAEKKKKAKHAERLRFTYDELVETEAGFLDVLSVIDRFFRAPLEQLATSSPDLISKQTVNLIFDNLDTLQELHANVFVALKGDPTLSCRFFSEHKKDFLIYAEYCAAIPTNRGRLEDLCKRREFADKLAAMQRKSQQRFELKDLLSVPMQRVLRYPLLIRELVKLTPPESPSAPLLELAHESTQDVAKFLNEAKRDQENLELIRHLQSTLRDYNVGPGCVPLEWYGKYLMDSDVKVKLESDTRTQRRYLFLFSRAILVCKSRYTGHSFLYAMYIKDFNISAVESGRNQFAALKLASRVPSAASSSCIITFKTDTERETWQEILDDTQQECQYEGPLGTHWFEAHAFTKPRECGQCGYLLWGLFDQGLECKYCQYRCHKYCASGVEAKCPARQTAQPPHGATAQSKTSDRQPASASSSSTSSLQPQQSMRRRRTIVLDDSGKMQVASSATARKLLGIERDVTPQRRRHSTRSRRGAREGDIRPRHEPEPGDVYMVTDEYRGHADSEAGDLELSVGDFVEVVSVANKNWGVGRLEDGVMGLFPFSFCQHFEDKTVMVRSQTVSQRPKLAKPTAASLFEAGPPPLPPRGINGTPPTTPPPFQTQAPPLLPRQSPTSTAQANTIQASTIQESAAQASATPPQLPPRSDVPPLPSRGESKSEFWFAGVLSRPEAEDRLALAHDGCFLVRASPGAPPSFAISLMYKGVVKHFKIQNSNGAYMLGTSNQFSSIPSLVDHFRHKTLSTHFQNIETTLLFPCGTQAFDASRLVATAMYSFKGQKGELTFQMGDEIVVTSTNVAEGWWKGTLHGVTGLFPSNYVSLKQ
eukprot:m.8887 g.8887  ORF g.8887 m.8887 type:complete len:1061 (-) comp5406_c0_seq1:39-3221(-)